MAHTFVPVTGGSRICASTERVRQHRERRRRGLHLMTVAMPEASIEHAISRGLLKPEVHTKPWAVIQACYASWLSDTAMQWLIRNGIDYRRSARRHGGDPTQS